MITSRPRCSAPAAYSNNRSGVRCADTTRVSNGTASCSSVAAACCSVSQSGFAPMMSPANGVIVGFLVCAGRGDPRYAGASMSHDDKHKAELLDHLAGLIRAKLHGPEAHQVEQFTRHYYGASNLADLQDYPPEDLYGAALSHWRLAQRRRPGETSVHVYNPRYDQHGWQSTHTIVEIVTDDKPFLVATVSMERLRADARAAVEDWRPMRARIAEIIATLADAPLPVTAAERQETLAFLRWVDDDHFTFMGFRAYDLVAEAGEDVLRRVAGSGLGVLRDSGDAATISLSFAHIPAPLRAQVRAPTLLIITKSTRVSTVHRPVHLDYIGIKRYDAAGEQLGDWCFFGF